jgi:hypothetical protein
MTQILLWIATKIICINFQKKEHDIAAENYKLLNRRQQTDMFELKVFEMKNE